jgi:hypothetical protein
MASRKRFAKRGSKPLSVRWTAKIRLGGPPGSEAVLREQLVQAIAGYLWDGCERFAATAQPLIQAQKIAASVPFKLLRKREVVEIRSLEVDYKNMRRKSPGRWKMWIRVENGDDIGRGHAGDLVSKWRKDE